MNPACKVYTENKLKANALSLFNRMRLDNYLCDIKLKISDEGKSFPAHRIVLAATIPYFREMFTDEIAGDSVHEVIVRGVEEHALESMLNFAYSGELRIYNQNMEALLVASRILKLKDVCTSCEDYIKSKFDVNNILRLRTLADSNSSLDLLNATDQFISKNIRTVARITDFVNLSIVALLNICKQDGQTAQIVEHLFDASIQWIQHDEKNRSEFAAMIIQKLSLHLLTPLTLVNRVCKHPLIVNSPLCRQPIEDAMASKLLKPELTSDNLNKVIITTDQTQNTTHMSQAPNQRVWEQNSVQYNRLFGQYINPYKKSQFY